jgi:hypothetical protein
MKSSAALPPRVTAWMANRSTNVHVLALWDFLWHYTPIKLAGYMSYITDLYVHKENHCIS